MSSLLLVRHGQASFGMNRYDQLSGIGQRQARATGLWLASRGATFNRVISGPRRRQLETARLIISAADSTGRALAKNIEQDEDLDEFGEGEEILALAENLSGVALLESSLPRETVLKHYADAYLAWHEGRGVLPGRGSFQDFRGRVGHWLVEHTQRSHASGQKHLLVTSAGVISAIVCEVMGLENRHWPGLVSHVENASITEVLYSRNRLGMRSFNSAAHLPLELLSGI